MKKHSTALDTQEISLTIYNGGFGAVKETRTLNLSGEEIELVFADVSRQIEADSLLVEGLSVLEFNYDYDLVDRSKLLQKYIDREVFLVDRKTGEKRSCRLLSVEQNARCVFEDNSTKEIYIDTQAELVLPSLPSGLIVKPALVWKVSPSKAERVKVSYLSQGFNWSANYVVELSQKTLNIAGWAEIQNQSGTTFVNAKVKLIAGDVNRITDEDYDLPVKVYEAQAMGAAPQAEEKSFFDYYMYTLFNRTTLKDNQIKQINILNGQGVPYKRYYRLNLHEDKVNVVIEFANTHESGLGLALPKGKIKLYQVEEADNSLEFIGEDNIEHTPKDEEIQLVIGNAFDITFEYNEVDRQKIKGFEHLKYEYIIKNHKSETVEARFEHRAWGSWEMVSSTHEYTKKTSGLVEFKVLVLADSEIKVSFEYKVDRRTEVVVR
jgi:hypothetical protein